MHITVLYFQPNVKDIKHISMEKMQLMFPPLAGFFWVFKYGCFSHGGEKKGYSGIKGPVTPYLGCVQSLKNAAFTYSIQI